MYTGCIYCARRLSYGAHWGVVDDEKGRRETKRRMFLHAQFCPPFIPEFFGYCSPRFIGVRKYLTTEISCKKSPTP